MDGSASRGRERTVLRRAFGNSGQRLGPGCGPELAPVCAAGSCSRRGGKGYKRSPLTPFRAATSSGDPRAAYHNRSAPPASCLYSPNQVNGTNRSMNFQRAKRSTPGVHPDTAGSWWTGNQKYVYDSSDYIRYKHLTARNKNYDDKSFGGANNGAYVAWMASHSY